MTRVKEVLADRYELVEVLGRGGMGVVYAATDRALHRTVAIKVLPVDHAADPTLVARFKREALAAAALSHRNIVAVYDTGQDEDTHYIVMEYVRGESLSQMVRRRGPLDPADAAAVAAQIASALAAAHQAGIVHRDIKPANVMVDRHGSVKVLDFGIARVTSGTTLTHTSMVLGSAPYMAPEIAQGRAADARSDLYSLGCVLYELLTGRAPFTGELAAAVLHQHSTAIPQHPSAVNPAVPPELDALVMQMLAKAPSDRPQAAGELVGRLAPGSGLIALEMGMRAGGEDAPSGEAATAIDPTEATALYPTQPLRRDSSRTALTRPLPPPRPARPGALPRLLAAGALAIVLAIVLAILLSSGAGPAQRAADSRHRTSTHPAASTTHPASSTTQTSTTSSGASTSTTVPSTTATTPTTTQPPTVAAAAGALTTLVAQALQSGQIDQQAGQQILGQLQNIFTQYQQGHSDNALKQLSQLQQQLPQLADHGDITSSSEPGINAALTTLSTAITAAPTVSGPGAGDQGDQGGPGPNPGKGHGH